MADPITVTSTTALATTASATPTGTAIAAAAGAATAHSMTISLFGLEFNMIAIAFFVTMTTVLFLFYRIQASEKLDFADMITKDGRAVSLTKVLQLIGGITATWIMVKLTLTGGLTEALFGLYLTYVGAIEGYSKYVSAKYGYTEKSVKDAAEIVENKLS